MDGYGEPVIGANIVEKGTTNGTVTDIDGKFSLEVAPDAVLTISFIGYIPKEITLKGEKELKVVLMEDTQTLDEVVVVGYGTQKKESMVASITSVKPSDLNITSSSLTTAFAGNIAGMISRQTSGEPGYDSASFYIRGISTFGSSNSPLIILDGVEVLSNMLNNMPPESIESFSVLKDAQATSVYGSRGANGVILITTKRGLGSKGKVNITFKTDMGFSQLPRQLDIMNASEFAQYRNDYAYFGSDANRRRQGHAPLRFGLFRPALAGRRDELDQRDHPHGPLFQLRPLAVGNQRQIVVLRFVLLQRHRRYHPGQRPAAFHGTYQPRTPVVQMDESRLYGFVHLASQRPEQILHRRNGLVQQRPVSVTAAQAERHV